MFEDNDFAAESWTTLFFDESSLSECSWIAPARLRWLRPRVSHDDMLVQISLGWPLAGLQVKCNVETICELSEFGNGQPLLARWTRVPYYNAWVSCMTHTIVYLLSVPLLELVGFWLC